MVYSPKLRLLDMHRDLSAVADLIELCFRDQMDADGVAYIRQMRRLAQEMAYPAVLLANPPRVHFSGLVWEENGKIIGNVTLIPFVKDGKPVTLIANVAVHPDYRQRGIGRALTARALEVIRDRGNRAAWLQVREENQPAVQLYHSLGFVERTRRATWELNPKYVKAGALSEGEVTSLGARDWPQVRAWLEALYPPLIAWNLPFSAEPLRPGWWPDLQRWMNGQSVRHWALRGGAGMIGALIWEPSRLSADILWPAAAEVNLVPLLTGVLPFAVQDLRSGRPLTVNLPVWVDGTALGTLGFQLQNTLIWMEIPDLG